jgi:nucleoside-diphosphate-sugar epimerase
VAVVKVLVSAFSGFGGSRLRSALAEAGHDVVAKTRDPDSYGGTATPNSQGCPAMGSTSRGCGTRQPCPATPH